MDVGIILGLNLWGGVSRHLSFLSSDERRVMKRKELPQSDCWSKNAPSYNLISESGLYKLVMRSDKPEARKFQDWVTREVLPAIRKDAHVRGCPLREAA